MTENFIEERLKICGSCPYNMEEICILCGCPLIGLTSKKEESCVHTPKLWGPIGEPKVYKQPPQIKIAEQAPSAAPQFNKSNECIPCNKHRH